jgi:hypothetical protein
MRTADENKRAEVVYEMAYFLLPRRAHGELEELKLEFDQSPELGAMSYFVRAAKARGIVPNADDVRAFRVHSGGWTVSENTSSLSTRDSRWSVDLLANVARGLEPSNHVLAPYFSAIVEDHDSCEADYFVLGQSPDARTTLRSVSPTINANLGPGCDPELEAFLKLLRKRYASRSRLS